MANKTSSVHEMFNVLRVNNFCIGTTSNPRSLQPVQRPRCVTQQRLRASRLDRKGGASGLSLVSCV